MKQKQDNSTTRRTAYLTAVAIAIGAVVLGACSSTTASTSDTTDVVQSIETTATTESINPTIDPTILTIDDPADLTNGTTPESVTTQLAAAKPEDGKAFTDCLAQNGVVLPPGFALPSAAGAGGTPEIPEGVDLGKLQIAMGKCQDKMPAAAASAGAAASETEPFIQCLRDNGIAIPANATLAQIPAGDASFESANTVCESLLPSS